MRPSLRTVAEDEAVQHEKRLDVYGYTIVRDLLPGDLVERALSRVNELWDVVAADEYAGRPVRDARDQLVYNVQAKDVLFIDLLVDPLVRRLCIGLLNDPYYRFLPPDVPNYVLSYYNARSSGLALDLHIDSAIPSPGDLTWSAQVIFVLEESSVRNGCSVVVPGSHRSGRYTDRDLALDQRVPLEASPGDVVVWDSRLWHGTTENVTDSTRWALVATLTRWWVKQTMDITRSLPESIYAQLDDERRALLGFCAIPPADERERVNTKAGYDVLKPTVADYWRSLPR